MRSPSYRRSPSADASSPHPNALSDVAADGFVWKKRVNAGSYHAERARLDEEAVDARTDLNRGPLALMHPACTAAAT